MRLSNNLTLREATKSVTASIHGIKNYPNGEQLINMTEWAINIFQPLRDHFKKPIGLNSMFRCEELNAKIGGVKSSQHTKGEAGDIDGDVYGGVSNREIFEFVRDNLDFDQLIIYNSKENPDFVHVSYSKRNRCEVFFKDSKGYHPI